MFSQAHLPSTNTSSSSRFLTVLASIAAIGVAAFAIGLVFNVHALALFSVATSTLIILGAARDYAPTLTYSKSAPVSAPSPARAMRTSERHALAA